jgi:hypothetical protein
MKTSRPLAGSFGRVRLFGGPTPCGAGLTLVAERFNLGVLEAIAELA